jgi:hypothetical protein
VVKKSLFVARNCGFQVDGDRCFPHASGFHHLPFPAGTLQPATRRTVSAENEETFRWQLARVAVWTGILAGMALFWSGAAALIAGAIR